MITLSQFISVCHSTGNRTSVFTYNITCVYSLTYVSTSHGITVEYTFFIASFFAIQIQLQLRPAVLDCFCQNGKCEW